jgi:hypothetical protein
MFQVLHFGIVFKFSLVPPQFLVKSPRYCGADLAVADAPMRGKAGRYTGHQQGKGRDLAKSASAPPNHRAAQRVSNRIICPTSVSGKRRLIRFHKALPAMEASRATPKDTTR